MPSRTLNPYRTAALCLFALFLSSSSSASAQSDFDRPKLSYHPQPSITTGATSSGSVPMWTSSISGYTFSMVGLNPSSAAGSQTTTINAPVIPLIFTFSDGTVFDPTAKGQSCAAGNAQSLTLASPIFNNYTYAPGGTTVGTTQYHDFFQRANFWQYTNPAGVAPNYHMHLNGTAASPVRITVPAADGSTASGSACGIYGKVDINWFQNQLINTIIPSLSSAGVTPTTFPIFLSYDVFWYDPTESGEDGGYHYGFNSPQFGNAVQTYAVAAFDTSLDVAYLSHEVGEWMNDPIGNNPTPPWGNIGQVTGCQNNLEVGDPLTGTYVTIPMPNNVNYHLQELAFASWFFDQTPSLGVNGWYSSNGTFRSGAVACGVAPVASVTPGTLTFGSQTVGTSSTAQTVQFTNTGTAALTGISVSITGTNPGDFSETNNCSASLSPNGSCTVSVVFKPTATGSRLASLSFADNAKGAPQIVSLSGSSGGISFSNQRVTSTAPPASGSSCVTPNPASTFATSGGPVYLWFDATVSTTDVLSNDWLAPDGTVTQGKSWSGLSGTYCFASASLDISATPPNKLGGWTARVYHQGTTLFTIPFSVTASGDIAQGKPTFESDSATDPNGYRQASSNAVDGNTDGVYSDGSITHNGTVDPNAYWYVDLQGSYNISAINVWGRTDCCWDRLDGATIAVFAAGQNPATSTTPVWTGTIGTLATPSGTSQLAGSFTPAAVGEFVKVQLSPTSVGWLSLAEVQVFGTPSSVPSSSPVITSLNPSSATAQGLAVNVTIAGTGFVSGAKAQWVMNGLTTALVTQYVNATTVTAAVPANLLVTAGNAQIIVSNPTGTPSGPATFTINPPAGVSYSNQALTTSAPGSSCAAPPSATSFRTSDNSVYLYFEAVVTLSDSLSNDWLAPDGTVVTGGSWGSYQGSFCFTGAKLTVSGLPSSRLGSWQARVYDNGKTLFTIPFTVGSGSSTPFKNSYFLSHVADGSGWYTSFNLINPSAASVTWQMNLTADSGSALALTANSQMGSVFNGTLAPGGSVTYTSSGSGSLQEGYATVATSGPVVASGIFSYAGPGLPVFEAAVPAFSAPAQMLILPFDNKNGKATGLAIENTGGSAVTAALSFLPETGSAVTLTGVSLPANAKTEFVLTDKYPQLQNQRGTLTMTASTPVLTALGIRALPSGAFTSLPVYPVVSTGTFPFRQILSHVIDGGVWQSTITLVNTDTQAAPWLLRLFDTSGNPMTLTLNGTTASTFSGTLAPLTSVTLVSAGNPASALLQGWADVLVLQRVQAQLVFDQNSPGQPTFEAAIPAIADGITSLATPYDNTGVLVTGIAVANTGSVASAVELTVRDEAGNVTDNKIVNLAAGAKTAFVLTDQAPNSAGKRGMVQLTNRTGSLAALALRFNGLEFTTLPVAAADPTIAP